MDLLTSSARASSVAPTLLTRLSARSISSRVALSRSTAASSCAPASEMVFQDMRSCFSDLFSPSIFATSEAPSLPMELRLRFSAVIVLLPATALERAAAPGNLMSLSERSSVCSVLFIWRVTPISRAKSSPALLRSRKKVWIDVLLRSATASLWQPESSMRLHERWSVCRFEFTSIAAASSSAPGFFIELSSRERDRSPLESFSTSAILVAPNSLRPFDARSTCRTCVFSCSGFTTFAMPVFPMSEPASFTSAMCSPLLRR
mmetsp:Transcript_59597/g.141715  ORF Transcript_59597/g.141715 Transcript_59597/m.141715 type:complete len:261 (-) Transcript_59597:286-1068(-)